MTVGQAFDQSVEYYDGWIKTALPDYEAIFAAALDVIPFARDANIRVLDLGAGTGLFSGQVAEKYPQGQFMLADTAPKMLDVARTRFSNAEAHFQYLVQDFRTLVYVKAFDLTISSLAIHHLEHVEKRRLFANIFRGLCDGGVFINVDQIQGPSAQMRRYYWEHWLSGVRARGADDAQIQASIRRRQNYDRDATLVDQLDWLAQAGFGTVDCVYKNTFMGVFYARK